MKALNAIGLMSGTSLDGVDVALVEMTEKRNGCDFKLTAFQTYPYTSPIKERIYGASSGREIVPSEICQLDFDLGKIFATAVLKFLKTIGLRPSHIDLIGSHGQTICHIPRKSTLQIGEASVIAEMTGITTISDFRPADIAAGGEGAPLAPYFHYLLFRRLQKVGSGGIGVLNIGGMSNLTCIPENAKQKDVVAFDTGPGNVLIDGAIQHLTHKRKQYDEDGKIAAKGKIDENLLKQLLKHPFISKKPPKSTGREEFGEAMVESILKKGRDLKSEDIIATVTAFTAHAIAENYRKFILPQFPLREIVASGGGAKNKTLFVMLQQLLPAVQLKHFEDYHLNGDAIEAMAFAVLAYEAVEGQSLDLRLVTGARHPVILGKISPGHNFKRVFLN
ncbi:MAG: anhydro-N-acetylmuramic acid kinase [Deltaproteobacteria bacterium]